MTASELVYAVRLAFVNREQRDSLGFRADPRTDATEVKYRATRLRPYRTRRRAFLKSPRFAQLADGFLKAQVVDPVVKLVTLVEWLESIAPVMQFEQWKIGPRMLGQEVEEKARRHRELVSKMREAAPDFCEKIERNLLRLADRIDSEIQTSFIAHGPDVPLFNTENVGQRGSDGGWRGLLIREVLGRLPPMGYFKPHPFALVAHLLSWAGIKDVDSVAVRTEVVRLEAKRAALEKSQRPTH